MRNYRPIILLFTVGFLAFATGCPCFSAIPKLVAKTAKTISTQGRNTAFPSFSRDDLYMAFCELSKDKGWELVIVDKGFVEIARISDLITSPTYAYSWSTQGARLLYCARAGRSSIIKSLDLSTQRTQELFRSSLNLEQAHFMPQDQKVVVKAFSGEGVDEHLLLINLANGLSSRISSTYPFLLSLRISENGDIVFDASRGEEDLQSGGQDIYFLAHSDIGRKEPTNISLSPNRDEFFPVFSEDYIICYGRENGEICLMRYKRGKKFVSWENYNFSESYGSRENSNSPWEIITPPPSVPISMTTHQGFAIFPTPWENGIIFATGQHMRPLWHWDKDGYQPLSLGQEQAPRKQNALNQRGDYMLFQADLDSGGTTFIKMANIDLVCPVAGMLKYQGGTQNEKYDNFTVEIKEDSGIDQAQLILEIERKGRPSWKEALSPDINEKIGENLWFLAFSVPGLQDKDRLNWHLSGLDGGGNSFENSGFIALVREKNDAMSNISSGAKAADNMASVQEKPRFSQQFSQPIQILARNFHIQSPPELGQFPKDQRLYFTIYAPEMGERLKAQIKIGNALEQKEETITLYRRSDRYEGSLLLPSCKDNTLKISYRLYSWDDKPVIILHSNDMEIREFSSSLAKGGGR